MKTIARVVTAGLALLIAIPAVGDAAEAVADYPSKPIRFVLPFPAGSGTDASARFVAQAITEMTKQPVVVDNKPGGDGIVAAVTAAHAPADGYTVFITTMTTQSVNPHLHRKLPYDPVKDFAPVTLLTLSPMILVVRNAPDQPKSLEELTALARKRDGKLNYATGNTSSRVAAEFYAHKNGLHFQRVPYRGTPQGLTDLLGGQVDFMFPDLSPAVPLVKDGQLRGLTVTAATRLSVLPQIPTTKEAGLPDLQLYTWAAAFVPSGTPPAIVEKLNGLMVKALKTKAAVDYYAQNGVKPAPSTTAELAAFCKSELENWGNAVKVADIEVED
jgi:tripartite-type tricarboxylate transporter receptor subunit TctC